MHLTHLPLIKREIAQFSENRKSVLESGDGGIVILPDNVSANDTVKNVVYNDDLLIGSGRNVIGAITYTLGDRIVGAADIVFNEQSGKMTDAEFNNKWPVFMIPVDIAFQGVDMSTLSLADPGKNSGPQKLGDIINLKAAAPYAIGIGAAAAVIILGLLGIVISRRR